MVATTQTLGARSGLSLVPLTVAAATGIAAAALTGGAQMVLHMRDPGVVETAWSAGIAGIAGAVLYYALARTVRHPARALWGAALAIAAIDTLLVILLPLPAGHGPHLTIPISGLVIPIRQMLALVGLGHFGTRHYPAALVPADAALHFLPAVVVGALVPRLAGTRRA